MVRIGVVLGSIRPGRLDKAVAEWDRARKRGDASDGRKPQLVSAGGGR
jgi:hypothetical protein